MFDTFDLLVPELLLPPDFTVRQHETAFGPDDDRYVHVAEVRLGRLMQAKDAYSSIEAWTGRPGREAWTVLLLRTDANMAAQHDPTWQAYAKGLATLLRAHKTWRVTCESDCEQHPIEMMTLTADELVALVDRCRETHHFPVSFCAETNGELLPETDGVTHGRP